MLRAISGWRDKLAYASALLFPSSEYLADHGQSRAGRLRRGAQLVRERR
jgi:hypothetical protein